MYRRGLRARYLLLCVGACTPDHHYATAKPGDTSTLYVELATEGSHDGALRAGAEAGLANLKFAVPVDRDGDVGMQVELSGMHVEGKQTVCQMKILVTRGQTHDLLGIADGAARATGTHGRAGDDCIASLGASLVRGKVRPLLQRGLAAKR